MVKKKKEKKNYCSNANLPTHLNRNLSLLILMNFLRMNYSDQVQLISPFVIRELNALRLEGSLAYQSSSSQRHRGSPTGGQLAYQHIYTSSSGKGRLFQNVHFKLFTVNIWHNYPKCFSILLSLTNNMTTVHRRIIQSR